MDFEKLQKFLPYLIFFAGLLFATIAVKTLCVSVPVFVASFTFAYPSSAFLLSVQITLTIFWVLFVLGYCRASAHCIPLPQKLAKPAKITLTMLALLACGTMNAAFFISHRISTMQELILGSACIFALAWGLLYFLGFYIICPLLVLKKEHTKVMITVLMLLAVHFGYLVCTL